MKKKVMGLVLLLICCVLIAGCGKKDEVDNRINLSKPDNIKVESFYSEDNTNMILKITNEGNEDIKDLDVSVDYPNSSNDLLNEDEVFLKNLKANSFTYAALMLPINESFNSYVPDKINLDIKTEGENIEGIADTSDMVDKVKATYSVEDNLINFTITNDTNKILGSVSCILVYMKDGKALDVEDTYNIERDVLFTGDLDEPKYIEYDNIEVYVTSITDDYVESNDEEYSDADNEIIDDEPIEEDDDENMDY